MNPLTKEEFEAVFSVSPQKPTGVKRSEADMQGRTVKPLDGYDFGSPEKPPQRLQDLRKRHLDRAGIDKEPELDLTRTSYPTPTEPGSPAPKRVLKNRLAKGVSLGKNGGAGVYWSPNSKDVKYILRETQGPPTYLNHTEPKLIDEMLEMGKVPLAVYSELDPCKGGADCHRKLSLVEGLQVLSSCKHSPSSQKGFRKNLENLGVRKPGQKIQAAKVLFSEDTVPVQVCEKATAPAECETKLTPTQVKSEDRDK
jgi:hypothetical protein